MASDLTTVQYLCDQAELGARLTYKKMFGEYALYLDGKVIAFICDDQLFVKPTAAGRDYLGTPHLAPPYPIAKPHFLLIDEIEDPEALRRIFQITADALPAPKPRLARPARRKIAARKK